MWTRQKTLKAKGDIDARTSVKRISPYRVYKRETAAQIKSEYPAMSNEERSQIVKERWHTISDKMKAVYVALARLEEEKLAWDAIQDFYKERIDVMRDHAGMSAVQWPLWKQTNLHKSGEGDSHLLNPLNQNIEVTPLSDNDQTDDGQTQPVVKIAPPEVPKKSGKSTTPSGSDDQDNAEVSSKEDNQSDSSFAEKLVDSVLAEEDAIEKKIKLMNNSNTNKD